MSKKINKSFIGPFLTFGTDREVFEDVFRSSSLDLRLRLGHPEKPDIRRALKKFERLCIIFKEP